MRMTRPGLAAFLSLSLIWLAGCRSKETSRSTPGRGDTDTDVSVLARAATNGPRTSPFAPPTENDHTFVTDSAPKLDTGCTFRSGGPLEFDIEITRHAGELNPDGTLRDAAQLIADGLLSSEATLTMPGFDVDSRAVLPPPDQPERDRVLFNGEEIGFLDGENGLWKLNTFQVDIRKVKFAARGAPGTTPTGARNHVVIHIDTANADELWCTSVDWGALTFKAMSPVLLVHGNNSDGGFFDRQGFTGELARRHLLYDNSITMPTDTVAAHGTLLNTRIPAIVRSFGVDSIHLVAHSKGGLDSREYLALYQPGHEGDFKVLSYNTLSTPHNGSVLADVLVQRDAAALVTSELEFSGFPRFSETAVSLVSTDVGTTNLTTAFTAAFNLRTVAAVSPATVFHTVAADADTNGNGELDRSPDEYRELRDESASLRNLDLVSQTLSRIAVNTPYQMLRRTASVSLTYATRTGFFGTRTVAVLTAAPSPAPVGNDALVTIPSGQGAGSVAARVAASRVYTGGAGRNHSNVANAGVAADLAPLIIGVERSSGDLR